jgi:hypothetical protein
MMKWRLGRAVFCAIVLACSTALAQEPRRTPEPTGPPPDTLQRRNSAGFLLERNVNTYDWIARIGLDTLVGGTRATLRGQHASNIIVIGGHSRIPERRLQSNRQDVLFGLNRSLTGTLSARTEWSSFVYTDKKAIGLSAASIHSLLAGLQYDPLPEVSFIPMAGYRWEKQTNIADRGFSYAFSTHARDVRMDDYHFGGAAYAGRDLLDPRVLEKYFARIGVQKSFLGRTRDSLGVTVSCSRREFYAPDNPNIEGRIETNYSFANLLDYELYPTLLGTIYVNISGRQLDKFGHEVPYTSINEFLLNAFIEADYRGSNGGPAASMRLSYAERDEIHAARSPADLSQDSVRLRNEQERTKDNVTRRTALGGIFAIPLSSSDTVSCSGIGSILRYDTPSSLNADDRDELLVALSLNSSHHVSRTLDLRVSVDGNLGHTVYLFASRSDNNNINRVLRMMPRLTYRPARGIVTVNAFEVLANYTVYDFEEQMLQARSFSYRQFGWVDSTSAALTSRIGLDFYSYLKLYERGQLNWGDFTERSENSFVDQTYFIQARFEPSEPVLFAVGFRYFRQLRHVYEEAGKRLESSFRSAGPTCSIFWTAGPHSQIRMEGWFEQRRQTDGSARAISNMTLNIQLKL